MSSIGISEFGAGSIGILESDKSFAPDLQIQMMKPLTVAILATLPIMLAACCSDVKPRFWKVRDTAGGGNAYTVDTVAVPANSLMPSDKKYVDAAGKYVNVASPKLVCELSEPEWKVATSGARYSLRYCGLRMACWAKAKDR